MRPLPSLFFPAPMGRAARLPVYIYTQHGKLIQSLKEEMLPFATTCRNLQNITPSQITNSELHDLTTGGV